MITYNIINAHYGIKAAIILERLIYFTASNKVNNVNQHYNRTYVKINQNALAEQLNMSLSSIKYNIKKLHKLDAIEINQDLNTNKYDKTNWYSLSKEFKEQIDKKVNAISKSSSKLSTVIPKAPSKGGDAIKPKVKAVNVPHGKIFERWYKFKFNTDYLGWNQYTRDAYRSIVNQQVDIIEKIANRKPTDNELEEELDWLFYTAHVEYIEQVQKFNVMYIETCVDRLQDLKIIRMKKHFRKVQVRKLWLK